MRIRRALLRTTMLVGVVGATYMWARDTKAAEPLYSPDFAAVDGFNGKVEGFGGSLGNHTLYGSRGALSIPLAGLWGLQIDGAAGRWYDANFGDIGSHLFWRNPSQGLVGIYGKVMHWNGYGGINVAHLAAEGEYYWQRWTVQGIAGVEFGSSASTSASTSSVGIAGTPYFFPNTLSTTVFDVKTRFFDEINLKYYFNDDVSGYVGHRYLGGRNMLALGAEAALPLGGGVMASAFVEGRIGEDNSEGIWAGLKFYFGQKDKPLIARHRQDDPNIWAIDSLLTIASALRNGTTTTSTFCPPGTSPVGGGLC
jgi:hypothetical protein